MNIEDAEKIVHKYGKILELKSQEQLKKNKSFNIFFKISDLLNTKEEIEEAFLIFIDELIKQKTWNEKTKNSFIEAFSRIPSFIDNNLFCQLDNLKIENKNEKILYLNQLDNFKQDFEEKSSFIIKYIVNIENKL